MPVIFKEISNAWAVAVLNQPPNVIFGNCNDRRGTQVYIEFTYKGDDVHVSMNMSPGGDCRSFHVTDDDAPKYITQPVSDKKSKKAKAGGAKYVKGNPSYYYEFTVGGSTVAPTVTFSGGVTEQHTAGMDKAAKVVNGIIDATLKHAVEAFMREFIVAMVVAGQGSIG